MNKLSKVFALLMVTSLILGLGMMAFAEEPYSTTTVNVTVNGYGHSFSYVQIFQGSQAVDGNDNNQLGDIEWGPNVAGSTKANIRVSLINAVNEVLGLSASDPGYVTPSGNTSAHTVAEAISLMNDNIAQANQLARKFFKILRIDNYYNVTAYSLSPGNNLVQPGYYLIFDQNIGNSMAPDYQGDSDAANAALLQMTRDIVVTPKTDAPYHEKKVYENTKYDQDVKVSQTIQDITGERTYGEGFNDVADHNIGDVVTFKLYSTIPDMTYYDKYKFEFTDGMTQGLSLLSNDDGTKDITVQIGGKTLEQGKDWVYSDLTEEEKRILTNSNASIAEGHFIISVVDAFKINLQSTEDPNGLGLLYLVKEYMAEITGNANATLAEAADYPITVTINAKLNEKAGMAGRNYGGQNQNVNSSVLTYSSRPEFPNDTNTTKVDSVIVFTYELDLWKIDGNPVNLPEGASVSDTAITYRDNDTYYIKVGGKWYLASVLDGAQFCLKAKTGTHKDKYVTVDDNNRVSGWLDIKPAVSSDTPDNAKKNGVFISTGPGYDLIKILGLDDGEYELEELKAPAGYNSLAAPVPVTISVNTYNRQDLDDILNSYPVYGSGCWDEKISLTVGENTEIFPNGSGVSGINSSAPGLAIAKIMNNSGTVLPSTGGIGTTLFYSIGGILVLAAGILLITKKRMGRD